MSGTSPAVETASDFGETPEGLATRWKTEISAFDRERDAWMRTCLKVEDRYRDQRDFQDDQRRFALLWANVEVLTPTLYARTPKPEVSRRFKDRDPVGRIAAMILERNLDFAADHGGAFDGVMKRVVQDMLLFAQGVAWVRYDMDTDANADVTLGDADQAEDAGAAEPAAPRASAGESVEVDFVHRSDFGFTAGARCWAEVTAVWRRVYMTRAALIDRFGAEVGSRVPLDRKSAADDKDTQTKATFAKASVYEVWDGEAKQVCWVNLSTDLPLDARPYPYMLPGDFPCPEPMFGTLTSRSMTPVPDYRQYQDQARELDDLTGRISMLTRALRLVGFTSGDVSAQLQAALDSGREAELIPVPSWASEGGGGVKDVVSWLPVADIAQTIMHLVEIRQRVKDDAYEITGLSDILRGATEATETATAQTLKAQWGSIRVRARQQDVQRFAADLLRIMASLMCQFFEPQRLAEVANVSGMSPADQQFAGPAIALLKGDAELLQYRVDVETDSTVEADNAADKAAWGELLTGVSQFMGSMIPVVQGVAAQAPQAAPALLAMVGELLTGAVRRFNAGPAVEASIEAAMDALAQAVTQPPPQAAAAQPPPDPAKQLQAQAAMAKAQVAGVQAQTDQQRLALEQAKAADESIHRSQDRQVDLVKVQAESQRTQADAAIAANGAATTGF